MPHAFATSRSRVAFKASFFLMPDLGDKKELKVIVQQSNQQRANMEEMITGGN
jgi:hypothetical protein